MSLQTAWSSSVATMPLYRKTGTVTRVGEMGVEANGPQVSLGEVCALHLGTGGQVQAEVVALEQGRVLLMPYARCAGLAVRAQVTALDQHPSVGVGPELLGRAVDAFAQPLDGGEPIAAMARMPLHPPPINPLQRSSIDRPLETGIRVFDALLPVGKGQRIGIFSGSGVGKSSLLGMLARNVVADVNVVALIGERGREVQEFLAHGLGAEARRRTVVIAATSEQPAVVRARAAYAATAIAEYFRDRGKHVLLLMDSITRFAMARREIDLAAGQPPTVRGYTPSVFSAIPALCERGGGLRDGGSITAMYTVLVDGDDHNEPIADTLRSSLDGHVVLSRDLANDGHFPAIDLLQSVSRLDTVLLGKEDLVMAQHLRSMLAVHRKQREMVDMGLYKSGTNADLDAALDRWNDVVAFLRQGLTEVSSLQQTRQRLSQLLAKKVGRP